MTYCISGNLCTYQKVREFADPDVFLVEMFTKCQHWCLLDKKKYAAGNVRDFLWFVDLQTFPHRQFFHLYSNHFSVIFILDTHKWLDKGKQSVIFWHFFVLFGMWFIMMPCIKVIIIIIMLEKNVCCIILIQLTLTWNNPPFVFFGTVHYHS